MKNLHKKNCDQMEITAGADIASGGVAVVVSGPTGLCGVAPVAIANGAVGDVLIKNHSVKLPAESGTGKTFAPGDLLYWNTATSKLTKTATGSHRIGRAYAAKTASATTAYVILGQF